MPQEDEQLMRRTIEMGQRRMEILAADTNIERHHRLDEQMVGNKVCI